MRVFHCDHCGQLLFFENTKCVSCGRQVAYLPDLGLIGSLDRAENNNWRSPLPSANGQTYRLCQNFAEEICNWAVPSEDPNPLCLSCRLTRVIPSLDHKDHRMLWYRLEVAKRRLVFTLLALGLLPKDNHSNPKGPMFEFKADPADGERVLTGHSDGVITISLAEGDDAERERRRHELDEPYRTLLGHMRHESGHYYWDRLLSDSSEIESFRALFGDERRDYAEALRVHYEKGAPPDWQTQFVSAYASAHPWEDWAETWAHYLHIVDTIETASACGLSITPRRSDEPALTTVPNPLSPAPFDHLMDGWFALTYILNNLNRGLGLNDAYPFVLSPPAVKKLRFVDEVVGRERQRSRSVNQVGEPQMA